MIRVGIVGGSGYVAGELIRHLIHIEQVKIDFIFSHSRAGEPVWHTHRDLFHRPDLHFTDTLIKDIDLVFLCLGHGFSKQFLAENTFSPKTHIIDMSRDFRLKEQAIFKGMKFIYGLPSLNRDRISEAQYIANPGCFATAIQQALLPLAKVNKIQDAVHIHAITGSSGAGRTPSETTHFSWRDNNVSIYKAFQHQHIDEIKESLRALQREFDQPLNFLPLRGNFTRGIFASIYTRTELSESTLIELYRSYYEMEPYTIITTSPVDLKQVVNTPYNLIQVQKIEDKILVTSILDNMIKGAAGQAIENMQIMMANHFINP